MKNITIVICIGIALLVAVIIVKLVTNKEEGLTVGFSQVGQESAWRMGETKSVWDEARNRRVILKYVDAQKKQEMFSALAMLTIC